MINRPKLNIYIRENYTDINHLHESNIDGLTVTVDKKSETALIDFEKYIFFENYCNNKILTREDNRLFYDGDINSDLEKLKEIANIFNKKIDEAEFKNYMLTIKQAEKNI